MSATKSNGNVKKMHSLEDRVEELQQELKAAKARIRELEHKLQATKTDEAEIAQLKQLAAEKEWRASRGLSG